MWRLFRPQKWFCWLLIILLSPSCAAVRLSPFESACCKQRRATSERAVGLSSIAAIMAVPSNVTKLQTVSCALPSLRSEHEERMGWR